jgi:dienelactone hydrolase
MVVSHEFEGPNPDEQADESTWLATAAAFRAVDGGIVNMREALDVAMARSPDADATRIAVAGHSSAGSQALVFAAHDARVKLCAAFMPPPDYVARTRPQERDFFRHATPTSTRFFVWSLRSRTLHRSPFLFFFRRPTTIEPSPRRRSMHSTAPSPQPVFVWSFVASRAVATTTQ